MWTALGAGRSGMVWVHSRSAGVLARQMPSEVQYCGLPSAATQSVSTLHW